MQNQTENSADDYTAKSIRILSDADIGERFIFEQIDRIDRQYTTVTRDFLKRLLEAAAVTNTPLEPLEQRYLKGDKTVPKIPEVEAALLQILDDTRWR